MKLSSRLSNIPRADPVLRARLAHGLDAPAAPESARLAEFVAAAFGPAAAAVIHYGSHAQRSGARPESAHDFFVIVDRYADAYRALHAAARTRFRPATATLLAHVLPPNVVRLAAPLPPRTLQAKCAVFSLRDFARACSPRARDHFAQGRLFQQVQLAWARDAASRDAVTDALVAARARTYAWGRPFLPARFDVDRYCRVLLETSFAAEIRPEQGDRIAQLLAAQHDTLRHVYGALLEHLAATSILAPEGNVYRQRVPVTTAERVRARLYFARSMMRSTARWFKYVALFDNWLDYIVQKIARRTGVAIELTERERRWPLIFLWPRAIQFVRTRPQRQEAERTAGRG